MKIEFKKYKEQLFGDLLSSDHKDRFMSLIMKLHKQGQTKKEIYELFLYFLKEIQTDIRTKEDEKVYDILCDFMDGFFDYGFGFKILPQESM